MFLHAFVVFQLPKHKALKPVNQLKQASFKLRLLKPKSMSPKNVHTQPQFTKPRKKSKKHSSRNPYSSIFSNNKNKTRNAYEDLLSKGDLMLNVRKKKNHQSDFVGTAYAEFYPDTLKEDLVSAAPFAVLAKSVHQNIFYEQSYPESFPVGVARIELKKDKTGWYVYKWEGDGLAKSVLYQAVKTTFTEAHIQKISKRIKHKKLIFEFVMKASKKMKNYEKSSVLEYHAGKVKISNEHCFKYDSLKRAAMLSQIAVSDETDELYIDLAGMRVYKKFQNSKKKNRVPLWLKKMMSSKAYYHKLNRNLKLRL